MAESEAEGLTLDRFTPLVGETFVLGEGESAFEAELAEARSLREVQGAGLRSRQYSLLWRAPGPPRLMQGNCRVAHPALPALELFLVCIGPDAQGMRYEAVFT